jgi:hypothetical protein
MAYDLLYDGMKLIWSGKGSFKATSGMPGHQIPSDQCLPDRGPVPEGNYYIPLIEGSQAIDDGSGVCNLEPSWQIQSIPRGTSAGSCEPYWANWGHNRVRFEPADRATKNTCTPIKRGGFYLHDSTKGFSHGCIEIDGLFFTQLRAFIKINKKSRLKLKIKYIGGSTNGGTKAP